jgi:hypothetical protein
MLPLVGKWRPCDEDAKSVADVSGLKIEVLGSQQAIHRDRSMGHRALLAFRVYWRGAFYGRAAEGGSLIIKKGIC